MLTFTLDHDGGVVAEVLQLVVRDFKAFMRKGERMRASAEADSGDEDGGSPATGARAGGGSPGARGASGAGRVRGSG